MREALQAEGISPAVWMREALQLEGISLGVGMREALQLEGISLGVGMHARGSPVGGNLAWAGRSLLRCLSIDVVLTG